METTIRITKVYRGEATSGTFIYLNWGTLLKIKADTGVELTRGQTYLVLLRPSPESMKAIRAGKYVSAWDAVQDEEILAVVELK